VRDYEERSFNTGPVEINFAEGPNNGVPLVLLHGGSSRWQWWKWVIDALSERTHLFAPDLRGHGRSSWTPGQYRLFDYAADIESFLEAVVRVPAVLLGHSLGGAVALIVAAERPDVVSCVINEDGPLSADSARRAILPTRSRLLKMRELAGSTLPRRQLEERVADLPIEEDGRIVRFGDLVGEEEVIWVAETFRQHDPAMLDAVIEFEEMHGGYDESVLQRIKCPVVIFRADPERGGAITKDVLRSALSVLGDARSITFTGAGHSIHIEASDRFVKEVLSVIAALPATNHN
jgi:pimeloyl-ACP methyl ester carboxylesterase